MLRLRTLRRHGVAGSFTPPTPSAPANVSAPTITGPATQGQTLTGVDGVFTGYPTPTIARQWNRSGSAISGATGSTYTLVFADVGATITFANTADNGVGSPATATSSATSVVASSGGGGGGGSTAGQPVGLLLALTKAS